MFISSALEELKEIMLVEILGWVNLSQPDGYVYYRIQSKNFKPNQCSILNIYTVKKKRKKKAS